MKNLKAFTLLELIVVIVIVGVLAAFAIPNYTTSIEKAKIRDAQTQLLGIHAANKIYEAQSNSFWDPVGSTTQDLAVINDGLAINVVSTDSNTTYTYDFHDDSNYTVEVDTNATPAFTICLFEGNMSTAAGSANPCCTVDVAPCNTILEPCSAACDGALD